MVESARRQIGVTRQYDSSYTPLAYPNGDVPQDRGVCTDVVIRALRQSSQMDLQKLIHEDMQSNFSSYPKLWGLSKPDKNIDHRRVPNIQTYFSRQGYAMKVSPEDRDYLAGDIVTCLLPGNLPHIMIVSDKKTASGRPLVIHNIGRGTQEEEMLFVYPTTGHYRIKRKSENTQRP